jgi:outer membrane lipoprotein
MRALTIIISIATALISCASSGSFHQRYERADQNFQDVFYNPQAHIGEDAVWGGQVMNFAYVSEGTELTMEQVPLNPRGYPWRTAYSAGRFIIHVRGRLDPSWYGPRTTLVVHGYVTGSVSKPLGDFSTYTYPVVNAQELHHWDLTGDNKMIHCWEGLGWQGPYDWRCEMEHFEAPDSIFVDQGDSLQY